MSDTDDIWGDDGSQNDNSADYERVIAEREWARMHENFGNEGYREGIEEGKDDLTLQQGFNRGWKDGFRYGHELGKLRGLISPLLEYVESQPASADHKQLPMADREQWIQDAKAILRDLGTIEIENVYDKDYFDEKKTGPVPVATSSSLSSQEGGSCCKSGNQKTDAAAATGCCSQSTTTNGSGCCNSTTATSTTMRTEPSSAMSDTMPEGSEYSKPEAVVKSLRDRAARLLQQANFGHLVTFRD